MKSLYLHYSTKKIYFNTLSENEIRGINQGREKGERRIGGGVTHIIKIFSFAETFLWVGESKGYKKTEKEVKNE
ncbi:MAG: hypothetical protein IJO16_00685 [Clostridia bacterium]|nr:hypothetical protein [Clostridia bacterium]